MYLIKFTKQAQKDKKRLKAANLDKKAKALLDLMFDNPFATPPGYEKLIGNLTGYYSRRINIQHRIVYSVVPNDDGLKDKNGNPYDGIVIIRRMWTHYER